MVQVYWYFAILAICSTALIFVSCATHAAHGLRQTSRIAFDQHCRCYRMKVLATRPCRIVWHEIICPICSRKTRLSGQEYNRRQLQTCGRPACSKELRRRRTPASERAAHLSRINEKRGAAHAVSPKSGPYETNASAREWHLLSPDGTAYHFRNLALWIRDNSHLFDDDDAVERPQSRAGVTTRAQSALGKLRPERAEKRESWKGWRWLHQADCRTAHGEDKNA